MEQAMGALAMPLIQRITTRLCGRGFAGQSRIGVHGNGRDAFPAVNNRRKVLV